MSVFQNKKIQIKELLSVLSLISTLSLLLSGIFYLSLNTEALSLIVGQAGVVLLAGFFEVMGLSYFYLPVLLTSLFVFSFKTFREGKKKQKRNLLLLSEKAVAHSIILFSICSSLSVLHHYLGMNGSMKMPQSSGGLIGYFTGSLMYDSMGVFGSLMVLFSLTLFASLLADFFTMKDIKTQSTKALKTTRKGAVTLSQSATEQLNQLVKLLSRELAIAQPSGSKNVRLKRATPKKNNSKKEPLTWMSRANTLITDHLHIYGERAEASNVKRKSAKKITVRKTSAKKKTTSKKKTAKKKTAAKKTASKKKTTRRATKR